MSAATYRHIMTQKTDKYEDEPVGENKDAQLW